MSGKRLALSILAAVSGIAVLSSAPALAATGSPQWTLTAVSRPTNFAPGDHTGEDSYQVLLTNTGDAPSDGSPIAITDELPSGLVLDAVGASGEDALAKVRIENARADFQCALASCVYTGVVQPDQTLIVTFPVDVSSSASSSVTNVVRVSGGGAPDAMRETPTTIESQHATFGLSPGGTTTSLSSTQAGAHPDLTTSIAFNTVDGQGTLPGDPKDTIDVLPPGFAGADLLDTPACTDAQFLLKTCPLGSQIGIATLFLHYGSGVHFPSVRVEPVFNLTPGPGQAAKIGFIVQESIHVEGAIYLRGDYGVEAVFENINQSIAELDNVSLTVWGVPAAAAHYQLRELSAEGARPQSRGALEALPKIPFFANPTSCGSVSLDASFTVDSWQEPGYEHQAQMPFGPIVGCDRLTMQPSLLAEPTTTAASAPTGLDVTTTIPQTYNNAEGLSTSHLQKAVVTLPEGMTVNPSAGAGLEACTIAQFEEEAVEQALGKGCPNDSKLGTFKGKSPALKEEATGSVFIATPYANPFGSLLALYIVARIPNRGIIVKAAGEVQANPLTGQLVTTFDTSDPHQPHGGLPPVPVEKFEFDFRQGATSPLVTPAACGSYEVKAALTPWSDPLGSPLTPLIPPFSISTDCPAGNVPPLEPQVIAGTQNNDAASYSPFYLRITRSDQEQELTKFSTIMPPGLTGNLTGVPFCPDSAIEVARHVSGTFENEHPSCPAASEIGHTIVGAGVGSVLAQTPGKVYLAGPYHGAPFSVVAVTSATVGPFDLGTVVVRFALRIDPTTAQVEIDSTGSDPIPHIIDGIVVHVRDIRAYIDRPDFIINPTSCNAMSILDTVTGAGANPANPADQMSVNVNDPFQATNCAALTFKPSFKVSTSGKTSRKDGASLHVSLTMPGALGSNANIKYVKVALPRQLPSRLETIQQACPDHVFEANPANCSAASRIGTATTTTPILPVPLTGPVYFVSHAAREFPDLVIVLQGYGVTIDLRGHTFIAKSGQTTTTFETVPDAPVGVFELDLPQGPFSALAAPTGVCNVTTTKVVSKRVKVHGRTVTRKLRKTVAAPLVMPTRMIAQNGAVFTQNTRIETVGCPHVPARGKKQSRHGKGKRGK